MKYIDVTPWPSCERSIFYLDVLNSLILSESAEAAYLRNKTYSEIDYYFKKKDRLIILANFHLQYIQDNKCIRN